jgi:hypothetical protein
MGSETEARVFSRHLAAIDEAAVALKAAIMRHGSAIPLTRGEEDELIDHVAAVLRLLKFVAQFPISERQARRRAGAGTGETQEADRE